MSLRQLSQPSPLLHHLLTTLFSLSLLLLLLLQHPHPTSAGDILTLTTLDYDIFPIRSTSEAAVVEWGNSAIISALDAAVATFGPQTSLGAFFEVETQPVLADPINGIRSNRGPARPDRPLLETDGPVPYPGPLRNSDDVDGNLLVMTNDNGLSGVAMARIAKESGAAALMVVNLDEEAPDYIYSLSPENDAEAAWAEEHIDIPVIMVSLGSGNLITTATVEEGMEEADIVNNGMPERVRLYAAGDRPFFEDVSHEKPVLYLIHNLLTMEECESLIDSAKGNGRMEPLNNNDGDTHNGNIPNILESHGKSPQHAINVDGMVLWKGQTNNHAAKQIEERIEQVTGYPSTHFSDWRITRYTDGSRHELDRDVHPLHPPVATITVFLNDVTGGGEMIYPKVRDVPPIKVLPQRGMAVVHHNTDPKGAQDPSAVYGHLPLTPGSEEPKYVAQKFVYAEPLPQSRRIVLPVLAFLRGGKLPRWVRAVHDALVGKFGIVDGTEYFEKLCMVCPLLILFLVANGIGVLVKKQLSGSDDSGSDGADTDKGNSGKTAGVDGGVDSGKSKKKKKKKATKSD